jgi:hypothetical protein
MNRGEWTALTVGVLTGILVVIVGGFYLWDLATEVALRIDEMIHG